MKKNRMAVWVGLALVTMGAAQTASAGGRPDLVIKGLKAGQPHASGELLVKYRDGAVAADRDAVVQGLGAQKLETVRRGNRRHVAPSARYLGFSGLFCGISGRV